MAFERMGNGGLDYAPCRYGASRLLFRGPRRKLDAPFVAVLGGTETYGRFMEAPYPSLIEDRAGLAVVNLGCPNAGLDTFVTEPEVAAVCRRAEVVIVQVMGAQGLSNRFYKVHPRRNDRFVEALPALRALYPQVDFTEFHFVRHMLNRLAEVSPTDFETVRAELRQVWSTRMRALVAACERPVRLLWLARHRPDDSAACARIGAHPAFVNRAMLDSLGDVVQGVTEVVAQDEEIALGRPRLVFAELEELLAREMLGPVVHQIVADKLTAELTAPA